MWPRSSRSEVSASPLQVRGGDGNVSDPAFVRSNDSFRDHELFDRGRSRAGVGGRMRSDEVWLLGH